MNPDKLFKFLQESWNAGTITLSASTLEETPAAQLLQAQFPRGILKLVSASRPEKSPDSKTVFMNEVVFEEDFLNLKNLSGRVDFIFDDQNALRLKIVVSSPLTFKMSHAFKTISVFPWSETAWANPVFTFDSNLLNDRQCEKFQLQYGNDAFDPENEKEIIKGLFFAGKFLLDENWKWIEGLIGIRQGITFSGPLERFRNYPRFCFSSPRYAPVVIGHLTCDFAFDMLGLLSEYTIENTSTTSTNFYYSLNGQLAYKLDESTLTVPMRTLWAGQNPKQLLFTIDTETPGEMVLDKLCALFQVQSFANQLPDPSVLPIASIVLKKISFTIQFTGGLKLTEVGAFMGLPAKTSLTLFPGLLHIENFNLDIRLFPGLKPTEALQLTAIAETKITHGEAKGSILSYLRLPEMSYGIELSPKTTLDLGTFVKKLLPVLSDAPVISCNEFYIRGNYYNKEFSLGTQFSSDFEIKAIYTQITDVGFDFNCRIGEQGKPIINAGLGATIVFAKRVTVVLNAWVNDEAWNFSGSAVIEKPLRLKEILPGDLQLPEELISMSLNEIGVEFKPATSYLKLDVTFAFDSEINLGIAKLVCKGFSIEFEKDDTGYTWTIHAYNTGLKAGAIIREGDTGEMPLIDIVGDFTIKKEGKSFSAIFTADTESGWVRNIPLLIPSKIENGEPVWSAFDFRIASASFTKDTGWEIRSKFEIKITRTWDKLKQLLSDKAVEVELIINKDLISLALTGDLLRIPVPEIKTPDGSGLPSINLGKSLLSVSGLTLTLEEKKRFRIDTELRYFLPEHLNKLFGVTESGEPLLTIFKTYKPKVHEQYTLEAPDGEYLGLKFFGRLDGGIKIGASISSIPVVMLSDAKDPDYWAIELGRHDSEGKGELGSIWIKKGEFAFDSKNGGFAIDVGWKVNRDPKIPLRIVKELLKNSKVPDLYKLLPDHIPVPISNPPRFIITAPDKKKYLNTKAITDFLRDYFKYELPKPVLDALNGINNFITEKLPDDFTEYLEFVVPPLEEFNFKLTVSSAGSVDLSLKTGQPLRILLPGGPGLTGASIREISFGMLFGGSMMKVFVDAYFDTFHVANLAAAILGYIEPIRPYIGNPTKFRSRLYFEKLTAVLFTQFPIPIPLFYDKLGVEYKGPGDFEFQSIFTFKAIELNLAAGGEFLMNLVQFFTKKEFAMPVKDYQPMDLKFVIGPNYMRTGEWLGKKTIGLPEGLDKIPSVGEAISWFLNTIKFFDLDAFISIIPFKFRMHSNVEVVSGFMGMKANGSWLLTTPTEFIERKIYQEWEPSKKDSAMFMRIMPGNISPTTKGLIIFLSGDWNTGVGNVNAAFGLIAVNTGQFGTGFRFSGNLGNFFNAGTEALVKIQPNANNPIEFEGKSRTKIQVAGINFFEGDIVVAGNKNEFSFAGSLKLNEVNQSLTLWAATASLKGLLRENYFNIEGGGEGRLLIYQGSAYVIARYDKKQAVPLTSSLVLTTGVGTFTFILNATSYGFRSDAWLKINGDLLNLNCKTELYQNKNERWIKFDLFAEPAGGLLRLESGLRLDFGRDVGVQGSFTLSLIKGSILLFNGKCTYQVNKLDLSGTVKILDVLSGTITGSFNQGGFSIGGSITLTIAGLKISETSITITERGVTVSLQIWPFPPAVSALRTNGKDELILCGPTFWINLSNGKFDLANGCPTASPGKVKPTFPMAGAILYRSSVLRHGLLSNSAMGKQSYSDRRYIFESKTVITRGKLMGTSVKAIRRGVKNDFFTELLNALHTKYPDRKTEGLNLDHASVELKIDHKEKHILIFNFPNAENIRLKHVEIELQDVERSDELMPALLNGFKELLVIRRAKKKVKKAVVKAGKAPAAKKNAAKKMAIKKQKHSSGIKTAKKKETSVKPVKTVKKKPAVKKKKTEEVKKIKPADKKSDQDKATRKTVKPK